MAGQPDEAQESGPAMLRVLVVESDTHTAAMARRGLARAGFEVQVVTGSGQAMVWVQRSWPDLVVLDPHLPGDDGLVFQRIRECSHVPVVMISPIADGYERAWGLTLGADDFVPTPLSPDELVARVQSVLRRSRRLPPLRSTDDLVPERESMLLDVATRRVWIGGVGVSLTALEARLLEFLASHPAQALSRQELLERVWGYNIGDLSTVTVHVRRLREKLEPDPAHPVFIVTVWGVGYRFDPSGGRDDRGHR